MATILQILPELSTGGAEKTTVDVAKALVDRGDKAVVMSSGGRLVSKLEECGALHLTHAVDTKNPLKIYSNANHIEAIIKERTVDLVHARSRAPAWSALRATRKAGIPFVTTFHGIHSEGFPGKRLYNSVMARGDRVIANSHYTKDHILARYPFAADKIEVIWRGTDLTAFSQQAVTEERRNLLRQAWGLARNKFLIVQVARLTSWKGIDTTFDAAKILLQKGVKDFQWIIAGSAQKRGNYLMHLEGRLQNEGLTDHVKLVGHCDDPAAALAIADLSVVASIKPEAFGRAAVEAQALACPVIVTNIGAVGETVLGPPQVDNDGRSGWRIAPKDASALAEQILYAQHMTPRAREIIGHAGRAHVETHFSVEKMLSQTLSVYDRILA